MSPPLRFPRVRNMKRAWLVHDARCDREGTNSVVGIQYLARSTHHYPHRDVRFTVHATGLFEKSAGALGAAGPRWDPFVNARARLRT